MWFRLAKDLGGRTVREWMQAMDACEFAEWCAFYRMEHDETKKQIEEAKKAAITKRKGPKKPASGTTYDMRDPAIAKGALDYFASRAGTKIERG